MAKKSKPAEVGHNSGVDHGVLKSIVQRIENLQEEKDTIAADIRDVFAEAKGNGFDVKTIRAVLKERQKEAHVREEQKMLLDIYLNALGM